MSKKRTSAESNNGDDQTYEGSDAVLQNKDNAKRAKLDSLISDTDTTLQDLPIELLGCILVKAVAMEVKGMKLAKSVWKEKAGPVINRLEEVCSQWSSILTTDYFRNEVNRVLDETAQERSHLEILHQYPVQFAFSKVTTNKDEIFTLCSDQGDPDRVINVYDRNNMAEVKDVIHLPRRNAKAIAACSVSNCLYVLYMDNPGLTMLRITKDEEHQFNISPWISDHKLSEANISVTANGSLIITSKLHRERPVLVSIYNDDGFLQHKISLCPDIYGFENIYSVIQKSDGNLVVVSGNRVVVSANYRPLITKLTEIDTRGTILRQYQSSLSGLFVVVVADIYGRILITDSASSMELFDSEFNLLDFAGLQLDMDQSFNPRRLHFNSARNEIVDVVYDDKFKNGVLTIFRLT